MKKLGGIVAMIGILGAVWLFAVDATTFAPPNAFVFLGPSANEYYSPTLVKADRRTFATQAQLAGVLERGISPATETDARLTEGRHDPSTALVWLNLGNRTYSWEPPLDAVLVIPSTIRETEELGATPDKQHEMEGAFIYTRSNLKYYLERLGIFQPRWDEEGQWQW